MLSIRLGLICLFLLALVAVPTGTLEASSPPVAINEVAWSGTMYSPKDEWIELINNTDHDINLTGWELKAQDGRPGISLVGTIPAHGYFLLERDDDWTVRDVFADQIYIRGLENKGEILELRDDHGVLIDSANLDGGKWPAGKGRTRSSMERICSTLPDTDSNWATNDGITVNGHDVEWNPINGTPKAANSQQSCSVTAITLVDFQVTPQENGLLLTWETGTEIDNAGFDLLRSDRPDGVYQRVNSQLIPATGDALTGGVYTFLDATPQQGTVYYILEDIDLNGERTRHGPVSALVQAQSLQGGTRIFLPAVQR